MPDDVVMQGWVVNDGDTAMEGASDEAARERGLRAILRAPYNGLPAEQLYAIAQRQTIGMSPEQAEDFWKGLADFGKTVAPIAAQLLPVVAPIVGTAIGGPAGAAVGQMVGQYGGALLQGIGGQPQPLTPPMYAPPMYAPPAAYATPPGAVSPTGAMQPPGGTPSYAPPNGGGAPVIPGAIGGIPGLPPATGATPATAQLLSLLQNPALLQALLSAIMQPYAKPTTPVGPNGASAPAGAFLNTVGVAATQAATEIAARFQPDGAEEFPSYLITPWGGLRGDPAVPEERASALLEQLTATRRAYGRTAFATGLAGESIDSNGNGANGNGYGGGGGAGAWLAQAGPPDSITTQYVY